MLVPPREEHRQLVAVDDLAQVVGKIREAVRRVDGQLALEQPQRLRDVMDRTLSGQRMMATLVGTRYIESQLFGVTATDPVTFVGGCALLAMAGLTASLIPALRALRVDPITALRQQ